MLLFPAVSLPAHSFILRLSECVLCYLVSSLDENMSLNSGSFFSFFRNSHETSTIKWKKSTPPKTKKDQENQPGMDSANRPKQFWSVPYGNLIQSIFIKMQNGGLCECRILSIFLIIPHHQAQRSRVRGVMTLTSPEGGKCWIYTVCWSERSMSCWCCCSECSGRLELIVLLHLVDVER